MSNMSYCRFQNTNSDLRDCESALESLINCDGEEEALSARELEAAKALVARCFDIASMIADASGYSVEELLDRDTEAAIGKALDRANDECRRHSDEEGAA